MPKNREDSDQAARMRSLIWVFAVRKWHTRHFHELLTILCETSQFCLPAGADKMKRNAMFIVAG